jgi:hypothetical protein
MIIDKLGCVSSASRIFKHSSVSSFSVDKRIKRFKNPFDHFNSYANDFAFKKTYSKH